MRRPAWSGTQRQAVLSFVVGPNDERTQDDREEFKAILQRAAELDQGEKREFSRNDLQEAARDLGLSQAALAEAQREQFGRAEAEAEVPALRPPFDTQISLKSFPSALNIAVPPLGLRGPTLGVLGFSLFWLTFIAFWTWGAAHGSVFFALFSIPFWLVGLTSLAGGIAQLTMSTELALTRQAGILTRRIGPFRYQVALNPVHLRPRLDEGIIQSRRGTTSSPFVALEHGTRSYRLLTGFSAAEQEWVHAELRRWLGKA